MITTNFLSETPILKGKDAKRFINKLENVQPLSSKDITEIYEDAKKFETRQYQKKQR